MSNSTQPAFLLRTATASKLGVRSAGKITYAVLTDAERQALFISITKNDGGGYVSKECVPIAAVERCFPGDRKLAFPAKAFAPAFVGRSSNNAGFMAAILRSEGLTRQAPDKPQHHVMAGDWAAWKVAQLAIPGVAYVPPTADKVTPAVAAVDPDTAAAPSAPAGDPGDGGQAAPDAPKVTRKDRGRKAKAAAPSVAPEPTPEPEVPESDAPPSVWAMVDRGDDDAEVHLQD